MVTNATRLSMVRPNDSSVYPSPFKFLNDPVLNAFFPMGPLKGKAKR